MTTNGDKLRDALLEVLEKDFDIPIDSPDLYSRLDNFLEELERLDGAWFNAKAK